MNIISNGSMSLRTGGNNERMRVHSDGNVTIGNTASVQPLTVGGNVLFRTTTADSFENRFQFIVGGAGDAGNFYVYNASETATVRLNGSGDSYINGGSLGIGTTSPSYKLEVVKTGADGINVDVGSDFGGIRLTSSTGAWSIRTSTGDDLFFYDVDNANQAVTFKRGGNVGIGNTNPSGQLDILTSNETMIKLRNSDSTSGKDRDFKLDDNNKFEILDNSGTGVSLSQGSTSWSSESDERLKENIVELDSVLENIDNLRAVKYNYKNGNDTKIGFIAQDWQEDFSEIIEEGERLSMKYTETIPVLLKAIQELKQEIEILKSK
jgi:hypothetical protein